MGKSHLLVLVFEFLDIRLNNVMYTDQGSIKKNSISRVAMHVNTKTVLNESRQTMYFY